MSKVRSNDFRNACANNARPHEYGDTGPHNLHLPDKLHEGRPDVDEHALCFRLLMRGNAASRGPPLYRLHHDTLDVETQDRPGQLGDTLSHGDGRSPRHQPPRRRLSVSLPRRRSGI